MRKLTFAKQIYKHFLGDKVAVCGTRQSKRIRTANPTRQLEDSLAVKPSEYDSHSFYGPCGYSFLNPFNLFFLHDEHRAELDICATWLRTPGEKFHEGLSTSCCKGGRA